MFNNRKKYKLDFIDAVSQRIRVIPFSDSRQGLDFLVSFFSAIRPSTRKGKGTAAQNMELVLSEMARHPILLTNLQHALFSQLIHTDLSQALSNS